MAKISSRQESLACGLQLSRSARFSTNLYFNGKLISTRLAPTQGGAPANEQAILTDRLGSVRVRTNIQSGAAVTEQLRYYPYGEEIGGATANDRDKFATYYRDSNTGLDYAINRYYGNTAGRFLTPDPYRASGGPSDPNSWNRYAYVQNNPVGYHDPSGLLLALPGDDTPRDGGGGGFWDRLPDPTMYGFAQGGGWRPEPRDPGEPRGEGGGGGTSNSPRPEEVDIGQRLRDCVTKCCSESVRPALDAVMLLLSQPSIAKAFTLPGSSGGTSVFSLIFAETLKYRVSFDIPTPAGTSLDSLKMAGTTSVGRAVGRWIPFLSMALLLRDVASVASCVDNCTWAGLR